MFRQMGERSIVILTSHANDLTPEWIRICFFEMFWNKNIYYVVHNWFFWDERINIRVKRIYFTKNYTRKSFRLIFRPTATMSNHVHTIKYGKPMVNSKWNEPPHNQAINIRHDFTNNQKSFVPLHTHVDKYTIWIADKRFHCYSLCVIDW